MCSVIAKKAKALQQELEKEQKKAKSVTARAGEGARGANCLGLSPLALIDKKVRRKDNTWQQMELYIQEHSERYI